MQEVKLSENQFSLLQNRLEAIFFEIGELSGHDTGFQIEHIFNLEHPAFVPLYKVFWSVERIRGNAMHGSLGTGNNLITFRTPGDVVEDVEVKD